jgi:hypothetical protein
MRRALLPLLLALAACSSNGGGGTTPTTANVAARFPLGAEANVIQVTVTDRQAARAADLVLPDGTVQPAYSLDTERAPLSDTGYGGGGVVPSIGLGVAGGSGGGFGVGTGIGLLFPSIGGPTSRTYSDQTVTRAYIRLPDPVRYREQWQTAKIRVRVGDPPDVHFVELAAPPPPA